MIFGAVYFAIRMMVRWADLISRLPIISGMNQIAGAILGGIQGLLIVWIGCLMIRFFSETPWAQAALDQIQVSPWLCLLYTSRLGAMAAELIRQKKYGYMVAVKDNEIATTPLSEVAGKLKTVDPESSIIQQAKMIGISFGDE